MVHPNMAVYAGTKFAVRAISEGLRQEGGRQVARDDHYTWLVNTNFTESMTSPEIKGQIRDSMDKMGISPDPIARAIMFAIEQPADVDVGEIIVRPTVQS
jgi:NADP-dependent 3-hydroxy acid dehydrogenase YdfG